MSTTHTEEKLVPMAHRKLVSIDTPFEVRYWTNAFEATHQEIRRAINDVGRTVEAVRLYLTRSKPRRMAAARSWAGGR